MSLPIIQIFHIRPYVLKLGILLIQTKIPLMIVMLTELSLRLYFCEHKCQIKALAFNFDSIFLFLPQKKFLLRYFFNYDHF
jgi:hypothetical protein